MLFLPQRLWKQVSYLGFSCLLLPSRAAGETKDLESLLPSVESQGVWQLADRPMRYKADNLYDFINGGAEVYIEYGFVQVISQEYLRGGDSVICTVYEMKNPTAAFGIFSYNRTPQKQLVAIGDGGFKGGFQTAFWQERYYVIVESYRQDEEIEWAVSSFARQISDHIGGHTEEPNVVERLPREKLVDGSAKLLGGPLALESLLFLGTPGLFELDEEAVVLYGEYGSLEKKAKLFLVIYHHPDDASRVSTRVSELFASDEDYRPLSNPDSWTRRDRYIVLGHRGNSLALVTDAASREIAKDILDNCWR